MTRHCVATDHSAFTSIMILVSNAPQRALRISYNTEQRKIKHSLSAFAILPCKHLEIINLSILIQWIPAWANQRRKTIFCDCSFWTWIRCFYFVFTLIHITQKYLEEYVVCYSICNLTVLIFLYMIYRYLKEELVPFSKLTNLMAPDFLRSLQKV